MTNAEAIEILKHLIDDLNLKSKEYVDCFRMSISELDKQERKKPIGIKIEGQDPYKEVGDIVDAWCKMNYYGSAFVTLSLDGRVTTEYLSFNGNNMEFEWDMDWWEGEKDIILLGFDMRNNVKFYGYPNIID